MFLKLYNRSVKKINRLRFLKGTYSQFDVGKEQN